MSSVALEAKKLRKDFSGKPAVDAVSLKIETGEIYGFLGPNGAGKSTMVKMLVGLLEPTGGTATVAGYDITKQTNDMRLKIGAALQETSLDDKQTGRELLELQGRLYGLRGSEIKTRIGQLSKLIDIGPALDKRIGTYSGGMKRRVDLAAALVHNPEILFLDEPTTGLDPISRNRVWAEVRELNKQRAVTIFLTTQYLEEADELAARVGIINKGKLVVEDTPAKLKSQIGNDVIELTVNKNAKQISETIKKMDGSNKVTSKGSTITIRASRAGDVLQLAIEAVGEAGAKLSNIDVRQTSLDDVFLAVAGDFSDDQVNTEGSPS